MSRVKLLGLTLVVAALAVTGIGVKDALAEAGFCQIYSGGSYCTAGPGGTCCYNGGTPGRSRLLRCQCLYGYYCSWVDGGSGC
jgi:hypothetical protein